MAVVWALLLIAILVVSWLLTLLGLPGNWLIVAATAAHAYLVPAGSSTAIGWKVVVALLVLATLGEIVELLAGAAGTTRAGGSKRGALLALVGSVVGGLVGICIGLPIPLVGPIVAAVLFAGLGAMAGAILGESWAGQNLRESWQIGRSAFWGRLAGTLAKITIGAVMIVIVMVTLLVGVI